MATRRAFILGSAAVAGGVAVGIVLHRGRSPGAQPPLEPGQVAITPYVIIDADGISLISPRAEMGQGIQTTLAALVAEELDVDFDAIHVRHGPASDLYGNDIFYGPQPFWKRRGYRPRQATGGQTSIRDGFVKMRKAGAAARMMLLEAASRAHGLPVEALSTRAGAVVHPDGRSFSYESLAADAATLPAPVDPPLKPRSEWRLLGKSLPRVDMIGKCTGTAEYGIDVRLPDLLHATVLRNPRLGGTMKGFDAEQARQAPGVSAVVPLADGVIVIASNTWYAMKAADLIEFDWGPAAYPDTTTGHEAAVLSALDQGQAFNALERGNVDTALDAGSVIGGAYRVPFLAHAPLEPLNATAWLRDGQLDIWAGNQFPTLAVLVGAKLTGLPRDSVRVHTTYMGGAFGRRFEMDDVEAAVRAAMAMPGRPVKVTYSRGEDLTHDAYRPMAMARFRAVVADGKPQALDLELASPSLMVSGGRRRHRITGEGFREELDRDRAITMGAADQPYAIANHRVRGFLVDELLPVGWWRSVGESQNVFFNESIIDELAHAAQADPLEMRLAMLDHGPSRKVLRRVAELADWGSPLPPNRSRGLAYARASGQATAQVLEVERTPAGIRLVRAWISVDVGIALDPRNIEGQVEGALLFGLSAAIFGEITITDGTVDQENFDSYRLLRLHQAPDIHVDIVESGKRIYGVGEAGTPTAAPALGNALFAATGERIRELPFSRHVRFA